MSYTFPNRPIVNPDLRRLAQRGRQIRHALWWVFGYNVFFSIALTVIDFMPFDFLNLISWAAAGFGAWVLYRTHDEYTDTIQYLYDMDRRIQARGALTP